MSGSKRILLVLALLYSAAHFYATGVRQALALFSSDFLAAFPGAPVARMIGRTDMFHGSLAAKWAWTPDVWHYGPILHLITLPLFAFASLRDAFTFWLFVNFAFAAVIVWLLVRELGGSVVTLCLVLVATLSFNPFYEALTIRAIEVFELLLLVAAFALVRRGRSGGAGALVGAAVMCKFLPLIYLPYFVLRRDWKALRAALAVIAAIAVPTQFILGWQNSGIVQQLARPSLGAMSFIEDQSLAGFVRRVIEWSGATIPSVRAGHVAILIAIVAICALFLRARLGDVTLEWWLLAAAMTVLPPHSQNYYAILVLPAYLFMFDRMVRERSLRSARGIALLASFLIVAIPVPLSLVSRVIGQPAWPLYLRSGAQFVGVAMLIAVCGLEMLTRRASHDESSVSEVALRADRGLDRLSEQRENYRRAANQSESTATGQAR